MYEIEANKWSRITKKLKFSKLYVCENKDLTYREFQNI